MQTRTQPTASKLTCGFLQGAPLQNLGIHRDDRSLGGVWKDAPPANALCAIATVHRLRLLSTMDVHTTRLVSSIYMLVLGVGIGMVMQVTVLAVQNAVDRRHLGSATS